MAAFLLGITEILLFVELLKFSLTKDKEHWKGDRWWTWKDEKHCWWYDN